MILDEETLIKLGYVSTRNLTPDHAYDVEIPTRTFQRSPHAVDGRSLAHTDRRAKLRALYWARRGTPAP